MLFFSNSFPGLPFCSSAIAHVQITNVIALFPCFPYAQANAEMTVNGRFLLRTIAVAGFA